MRKLLLAVFFLVARAAVAADFQGWEGPNPIGPLNFAPPGARIALMNQTPRVLVALVSGNDGAVSNFSLDLDQQPEHWQGPFSISSTSLFPAGAPITMMYQTPRVLVALVVGNDGTVYNFFLDLDQQSRHWQGPFAISQSRFASPGTPITLMKALSHLAR